MSTVMLRKTMTVDGARTSVKLETVFWSRLQDEANEKDVKLTVLVRDIAAGNPDVKNRATMLRLHVLHRLHTKNQSLAAQVAQLEVGGAETYITIIEHLQVPVLVVNGDGTIVSHNKAFAQKYNLESSGINGRQICAILVIFQDNERVEGFRAVANAKSIKVKYVSPATSNRCSEVDVVKLSEGIEGRRSSFGLIWTA